MKKKLKVAGAAIITVFLVLLVVFLVFRVRYRKQELIIRSGDRQIYGCLFRPRFSGSEYPLVVLGHGYGGSYSDNLDYGRYFAEHGIACYVFDFCGGSEDSLSTPVQMSIYTEVEDLNGITDYMLEQSWLEEDGLFLAGKSLGGSVAALVAGDRPEDVGGLILHYPYFIRSAAFGGDGAAYIVDDMHEKISRFHGRVLIFNGDEDKYVPLECTRQAITAYENADLIVMEGSGHGFRGTARQEVKEKMVEFIKETH